MNHLPDKIPPNVIERLAQPHWFTDVSVLQRVRLKPANWLARFLSGARFSKRNDIAAITLGHTIYFLDEAHYAPYSAQGLGLLGHEVKHVEQFEQLGFFRFYWNYLLDYFRHGYGAQIPFEAEAYALGAAIREHDENSKAIDT